MVLEVTAKTEDGKEVFSDQKIYMPQAVTSRDGKMVYGAQWKTAYIRDTSLQPFKTRDESFQIPLPEGVKAVNVEVEVSYQLFPGDKIPIHKVTKTVGP